MNASEDRVVGITAGEEDEEVVRFDERESGGEVVESAEAHTETGGYGAAAENIVLVEEVDGDAAAGIDDEERVVRAREDAGTHGGGDAVHAESFGGFVVDRDGEAGAVREEMEAIPDVGRDKGVEVRLGAYDRGDGG